MHALLVVALNFEPFTLGIDAFHLQLHATHGFRAGANKFAQRGIVFLFLLFVFFRMVFFVGIVIFGLGNAAGYSATIRTLVGEQEFRDMQDIVGGESFVQARHGQIQNIVGLEPSFQLGRNFQFVDELIAGRQNIGGSHFLRYVGVTPAQNVKRELAHGLRARCRGRNSGGELESTRFRRRFVPENLRAKNKRQAKRPWRPFLFSSCANRNRLARRRAHRTYSLLPE